MLQKRVLVLTPRFPYPVIGGDRVRILHACRALAARYRLTLLSLCETREELTHVPGEPLFAEIHRVPLPRWRSYWNVARALCSEDVPLQLAYYESTEFRHAVEEMIPYHDMVIAHLIRTGQYLEQQNIPRILEMTDAISLNYTRVHRLTNIKSWKRFLYAIDARRLQKYEQQTLGRFNTIWITSDVDRRALDSRCEHRIEVIPNGVDLEQFPYTVPPMNANVIVFIGNMESLQNQDACSHFIRSILPKIRSRIDVRLRVVGNTPGRVIRELSRYSYLEVTGRVRHVREHIADAFCGICPVRAGAGIQNKVLEYLALGLPCVTSSVGLEGIDAVPGQDLFTYSDDREAVAQILMLHSDPHLRLQLSSRGRSLVERKYSWNRVYRSIQTSAEHVLAVANKRLTPFASA